MLHLRASEVWGIESRFFLAVKTGEIIFLYRILYPRGGYNLTLYWVP